MPNAKHHDHVKPPIKEYLKGIPGLVGIRLDEEPNYHVRETFDDFEVRDYPQTLRAAFSFVGTFDEFRKVAFQHLADYIFANEIPMTIPVTIENTDDQWTMSFILPKKIKIRNAPEPLNKSVILRTVPACSVIVHKFSGNYSIEKMRAESERIENRFLKSSKYFTTGRAFWAFYDAPDAIPFLKRNEVWLPVRVQGA